MEKKKVTYNLNQELHQHLRFASAIQDREMVELVEEALNSYFGWNRMTDTEKRELNTYELVELRGRGQKTSMEFDSYSKELKYEGSENVIAADLIKYLDDGGRLEVEVWDGSQYKPFRSFDGTDCLFEGRGQMRMKLTIPGRVRFEHLRQRMLAETVQESQVASTDASQTMEGLVVQLKSLIEEPTHPLKMNEFLMPIAEEAKSKLEQSEIVDIGAHPTQQRLPPRIISADEATNTLARLFGVACPWIDSAQSKIFGRAIQKLMLSPQVTGAYYEMWTRVARYPALRVLYAGGIAACANDAFDVLRHFLVEVKGKVKQHEPETALVEVLHEGCAFSQEYWKWLPGMERRHTAASDHLAQSLRSILGDVASSEEEFMEKFDRFELFQAMIYLDVVAPPDEFLWAPTGAFVWRRRDCFKELRDEMDKAGANWAPLKAGLFSGSLDQAKQVVDRLEKFVAMVRRGRGLW